MNSFIGLVMSFMLNLTMIFLIISYIYRRYNFNKGILFSLYLFNIVVFALTVSFQNEALSMGSGFGMFVIFAMMRYRSELVSLKDMTYLLIVITLGVLHGILCSNGGISNILFMDLAIFMTVYFLEKWVLCKNQCYKKIKYNNMELIKPENKDKLWDEIRQKTGLQVLDIKIDCMNLMDNCVTLCVYYTEKNSMKILKMAEDDLVDETRNNSSSSQNSWNGARSIELIRKAANYAVKTHNSWLLLVILIALMLFLGVSMEGFAILV